MIDPTARTLSPAEAARAYLDAGERLYSSRETRRIVADLLALYEASLRQRAVERKPLPVLTDSIIKDMAF